MQLQGQIRVGSLTIEASLAALLQEEHGVS
jgi:hypothetical protein